jgi:hypothetical protein
VSTARVLQETGQESKADQAFSDAGVAERSLHCVADGAATTARGRTEADLRDRLSTATAQQVCAAAWQELWDLLLLGDSSAHEQKRVE